MIFAETYISSSLVLDQSSTVVTCLVSSGFNKNTASFIVLTGLAPLPTGVYETIPILSAVFRPEFRLYR